MNEIESLKIFVIVIELLPVKLCNIPFFRVVVVVVGYDFLFWFDWEFGQNKFGQAFVVGIQMDFYEINGNILETLKNQETLEHTYENWPSLIVIGRDSL